MMKLWHPKIGYRPQRFRLAYRYCPGCKRDTQAHSGLYPENGVETYPMFCNECYKLLSKETV